MSKRLRGSLGAGAALVALVFAGSALASYAPKVVVSNQGASTRFGVVVGAGDDPTAAVELFVPAGYQVATPSPGTRLGNVTASAASLDLGGAVVPLAGEVDAVEPDPVAQAACPAAAGAAQTWALRVAALAQTFAFPLYVVPTTGAETGLGAAKLVLCLPPPDVAPTAPGRALLGTKLLSATFDVSAITEPSSGNYRWVSVWTPYAPGAGTPNPSGSVETQAIRRIPTTLRLTVKKARIATAKRIRGNGKRRNVATVRTRVTFLSTATENGKSPASVSVTTTLDGKRVGGSTGSFILAAGKKATLVATASIDRRATVPTGLAANPNDLFYADLGSGACVPSAILGGLPCGDATVAATTVTATAVVTGFRK